MKEKTVNTSSSNLYSLIKKDFASISLEPDLLNIRKIVTPLLSEAADSITSAECAAVCFEERVGFYFEAAELIDQAQQISMNWQANQLRKRVYLDIAICNS